MLSANRLAILAYALAALGGSLAVVVPGLSWHGTAAVLLSLTTLFGALYKWLHGWQAYEKRAAIGALAFDDPASTAPGDDAPPHAANLPTTDPASIPPDQGDAGHAGKTA